MSATSEPAEYYGHDLIFIISMPRSGSTLLQRVLAGHADVGASSEPWIMLHQAYARRSRGIFTEYDADWAALGVNEFVEHYTDGDEAYDDAVRAFACSLYGNAMRRARVKRFIDKTPRYVMIVDELMRWFPQARFVFLIRNPLSVLASVVNTQIQHDLTTLERFRNELRVGPRALLAGTAKLGERAAVVHYEKFVAAPEAELERLCAQLDLSFSPAMLDYTDAPEFSGFMQDRTGITQHSRPVGDRAESWRQLLADPQQLEFARGYLAELGPELVNELGYSFSELDDAVREASARQRPRGYIYPWSVAILSPEEKKGRDQMHVFRYRAVRDHGAVIGNLMTGGFLLKGFFQALKFTFGRAKRQSELAAEKAASQR